MSVYKLHYFNITALGEPIRFLFHYGGINFEDIRYEAENWPEAKKNMPFGQMPVLEIDDKKVVQSGAICRYLAKIVGLAGDNDLENLEIDSIVDCFNDIRLKISAVLYETNKDIQAEKRTVLLKESIPLYFKKLDEIAGKNNGHMALKRLTWADLYVTAFVDYLNYALKDYLVVFEGYPNLQKVVSNTREVESIKKWLETRPTTMC